MVRREDIAQSVADAVTAVPGVASLHPGFGVEVATQFSGGKLVGVRLSGEQVEVCLTADRGPLTAVADEAAAAAARVLHAVGDHRPVNVLVADVLPTALNRRSSDRE
jgi:hypothetical protein